MVGAASNCLLMLQAHATLPILPCACAACVVAKPCDPACLGRAATQWLCSDSVDSILTDCVSVLERRSLRCPLCCRHGLTHVQHDPVPCGCRTAWHVHRVWPSDTHAGCSASPHARSGGCIAASSTRHRPQQSGCHAIGIGSAPRRPSQPAPLPGSASVPCCS